MPERAHAFGRAVRGPSRGCEVPRDRGCREVAGAGTGACVARLEPQDDHRFVGERPHLAEHPTRLHADNRVGDGDDRRGRRACDFQRRRAEPVGLVPPDRQHRLRGQLHPQRSGGDTMSTSVRIGHTKHSIGNEPPPSPRRARFGHGHRAAPHTRSILRIDASAGGTGRNAEAGIRGPSEQLNARLAPAPPTPRPAAQRAAAHVGRTRLANSSRLDGAVRRRSSAVVTPKGGLATTLNARRGNLRSAASARTTLTASPAKRFRSSARRCGCSSTAITDAPAATNRAVIAPEPAPTSTTRSPGPTSATSTNRLAQRLSSWCHPQRPDSAATEHHRRRHAESLTAAGPTSQRISPRYPPARRNDSSKVPVAAPVKSRWRQAS